MNNLPVHNTEQIISKLESITSTFIEWNKNHQVILCNLPFPPKHCETNNGSNLNMVKQICDVNDWILQFNETQSGRTLDLAKYGVYRRNGEVKANYEDWKEHHVYKKLHFSAKIKEKIAIEITHLIVDKENFKGTNSEKSEASLVTNIEQPTDQVTSVFNTAVSHRKVSKKVTKKLYINIRMIFKNVLRFSFLATNDFLLIKMKSISIKLNTKIIAIQIKNASTMGRES